MKVGILGGGVSGLSAAHYLLKNKKVTGIAVFEASNRYVRRILQVQKYIISKKLIKIYSWVEFCKSCTFNCYGQMMIEINHFQMMFNIVGWVVG